MSQTTLKNPLSWIIRSTSRTEVHLADRVFKWSLRALGLAIFALLSAIVYNLYVLSVPMMKSRGLRFFFESDWNPVTQNYGALAFAFGTVMSSAVAICISLPVSIAVALVLTELAPKRVSQVVGFLVEMLAAIPSVVYGLWGIFVVAPWLQNSLEPWLGTHFGFISLFAGPAYGVGMLAAGLILAIMITPTIASLAREVFKTIPDHQREAALGLGATRWEMIRLAVLKSSYPGIIGATMLGLGRALGETMAVTMVIGNRPDISMSLFSPAQTMASVIANEYAEATDTLHLSALGSVGLALFFVSLVVNSLARGLVWNYQRRGHK